MVARGVMRGLATGILAIAGCGAPQATHTVSWYLEHPEDLKAKVLWCADDAARRATNECQNALTANGQKQLGKMNDLPPIDWNKKN